MDSYFYTIIAGTAVAGISLGLLGVYLVGMRIPFIGTTVAHAAMAGAILAFGLGAPIMVGAMAGALLASLGMIKLQPEKTRLDTNVGLAVIFSLMLGITCLGLGLIQNGRDAVLSLLWGSVLWIDGRTVLIMVLSTALFVVFVWLFHKELKALLFSRTMAAATGIHETLVYGLLLGLSGLLLATHLPLVGGLLIFSLTTCPAAAAYQVCRSLRGVLVWSAILGLVSAVGGFFISFWADLPTGACIVLTSAACFGFARIFKPRS